MESLHGGVRLEVDGATSKNLREITKKLSRVIQASLKSWTVEIITRWLFILDLVDDWSWPRS